MAGAAFATRDDADLVEGEPAIGGGVFAGEDSGDLRFFGTAGAAVEVERLVLFALQ